LTFREHVPPCWEKRRRGFPRVGWPHLPARPTLNWGDVRPFRGPQPATATLRLQFSFDTSGLRRAACRRHSTPTCVCVCQAHFIFRCGTNTPTDTRGQSFCEKRPLRELTTTSSSSLPQPPSAHADSGRRSGGGGRQGRLYPPLTMNINNPLQIQKNEPMHTRRWAGGPRPQARDTSIPSLAGGACCEVVWESAAPSQRANPRAKPPFLLWFGLVPSRVRFSPFSCARVRVCGPPGAPSPPPS